MAIKTINDEYLSAIGDAIRNKNGTEETYKPKEMAAAISNLSSIPEEMLNISGTGNFLFGNRHWDSIIEKHGSEITTTDITSCRFMFNAAPFETIPFDINFKDNAVLNCERMFYGNTNLTTLPTFTGSPKMYNDEWMFVMCESLVEIPDSFYEMFDWSSFDKYDKKRDNMFAQCYALRSFPIDMLKHDLQTKTDTTRMIYRGLCNHCRSLDELANIPVMYKDVGINENMFHQAFWNMGRLKKFTFETNADGTAIAAKWSKQTIHSGAYFYETTEGSQHQWWGTASDWSHAGLPAYFTEDTRIVDDNDYSVLKNHPDKWTTDIRYSNYGLVSAIETIKSLPDTSAYLAELDNPDSNIIMFNGDSGILTDDLAIGSINSTNIAIAAAKGWTVSLV